jgi:hypothetical protein
MNEDAKRGNLESGGAEKDVAKDMKRFEALPAKTKELARLQDEAEKTSGPAAVVLQTKIKAIGEG